MYGPSHMYIKMHTKLLLKMKTPPISNPDTFSWAKGVRNEGVPLWFIESEAVLVLTRTFAYQCNFQGCLQHVVGLREYFLVVLWFSHMCLSKSAHLHAHIKKLNCTCICADV